MIILGVCGSLQSKSSNLTLLERAAELAPSGVELKLYRGLGELPHFNPDLDGTALAAVQQLRAAVAESDALLIACPEYGFSLPGALKNAIDWLIGTGELERKVVGVTASSAIAGRGQKGLDALLQTLSAVSARVVGGVSIARGAGFDGDLKALLDALFAEASKPEPVPEITE